ncbi:hypothetical protein BDN72DRAFT_53382 [Pluteus cervinus]|uniref:Uncharacterized protein n=1 Tax=Pluteus cervinus TaxID=181527 RepID=A0ACD3B9A0_9AGAR|nr:hypothetical protein BDN72DRAFT_53382 [Pluteus cervinus]
MEHFLVPTFPSRPPIHLPMLAWVVAGWLVRWTYLHIDTHHTFSLRDVTCFFFRFRFCWLRFVSFTLRYSVLRALSQNRSQKHYFTFFPSLLSPFASSFPFP